MQLYQIAIIEKRRVHLFSVQNQYIYSFIQSTLIGFISCMCIKINIPCLTDDIQLSFTPSTLIC